MAKCSDFVVVNVQGNVSFQTAEADGSNVDGIHLGSVLDFVSDLFKSFCVLLCGTHLFELDHLKGQFMICFSSRECGKNVFGKDLPVVDDNVAYNPTGVPGGGGPGEALAGFGYPVFLRYDEGAESGFGGLDPGGRVAK